MNYHGRLENGHNFATVFTFTSFNFWLIGVDAVAVAKPPTAPLLDIPVFLK